MSDLEKLTNEIKALPLAEKCELAAGLVRVGKLEMAQHILERALLELRLRPQAPR